MYISVLPLRKVVMVMMDMVKYCHICCRWDKCIYFVRKNKIPSKIFLIYFQNQPWIPSARSSSVPCGLFPVACGRCMEFAEIARPASGCLQCRYLCPAAGRLHRVRFFCYFCLPADGFSGAVRRFGFTYCPCCRDSRGVVAAAPGAGRAAGGKSGAYSSASPYTSPRSASSE